MFDIWENDGSFVFEMERANKRNSWLLLGERGSVVFWGTML
jgi:hypothetical protein